jgi:hypothetical protein
MEAMDAGGAEALIERRLSQAVMDSGSGTAVLAASGRFGVALAKQEDKLTLFTGALIRCFREGIATRSDITSFSWLDLKDEIVRGTRDRLGPDAPIPRLTSFSESASDITRTPFFYNRAFVPRTGDRSSSWIPWDDRVNEQLYWKGISEETPAYVLEDYLVRFPGGTFAAPARAFLIQAIDRSDEMGLTVHLRTHPSSSVKSHVEERLLTLQRDRIQKSTRVVELEQIVAGNPESELASEAKLRIDLIRRELAEREAWESIKTSTVSEDIRRFLAVYPEGQFSGLARARLAELSQASNYPPWHARVLGFNPTRAGRNWARYAAGLAVLTLGGAGALVMVERNSAVNIEMLREEFVAAGDDPSKLRVVVSQCAAVTCPFDMQARDRLSKAEETERRHRTQIVEAALDTAGIDLGQLRRFVQQCDTTSCAVAQEAHKRLAKAEEAETGRLARIAEADRKALDMAGTDVAKLRDFVDRCRAASCAVLAEGSNRLNNARTATQAAEAARVRIEADRKALDVAGTDVPKLRDFVDRCRTASCTMLEEASNRLSTAQAADAARMRAEADRKALDAAATDLGQLRKFVQQCSATSCAVAQESRNRLSKVEEAASRRAQIGFATKVNYDMYGGDIEFTGADGNLVRFI